MRPSFGQTVVVIGGSAGIGLETARRAREEGADVILTARDPDRLHRVGLELGAASIAAFDATDFERLGRFFVACGPQRPRPGQTLPRIARPGDPSRPARRVGGHLGRCPR
jgi:NAD(P)-dependent dehydrogenase (short-subunit alcohol dehydrogenase family)